MNAFADWLFRALLGWTGVAANSVWNAVVNASSGISGFLSRFWLPVVLLLVLGGTLLDYAVWLVRWRPYLVWRSWLTRHARRRSMTKHAHSLAEEEMDASTLEQIADWVGDASEEGPIEQFNGGLDYYQDYAPLLFEQSNGYAPEETAYFRSAGSTQPEAVAGTGFTAAPGSSDLPAYSDEIDQSHLNWSLAPQDMSGYEEQPALFQPDAWHSPPTRRRRSERVRDNTVRAMLQGIRERLGSPDDEEGMIDALPAPVKQEDAFHKSVYPPNYRYQQPQDTQKAKKEEYDKRELS